MAANLKRHFFLLSGFFLCERLFINGLHHLWPLGNMSVGYDVLEDREALYPPTPFCFPRGALHPVLGYRGLQFNGDNYIDVMVGDKRKVQSQFTFVINLYPDQIQINNTFFEFNAVYNQSNEIVRIQLTTDGLNVNMAVDVMDDRTTHYFLPALLTIQSWTYLAFTMHGDNRQFLFYKNGSLFISVFLTYSGTGILLPGRLRIGKSLAGSHGFRGSITCVQFIDKLENVSAYFQECDNNTNWLPVPGELCQWGNILKYAFALTDPYLGYEFKTDQNLTIKQPPCLRFAKGPTNLSPKALKLDGSHKSIADVRVPSNVLKSYTSQAFFVYIESNWSGTILDYLVTDQDSSYRMTLSVSLSKMLVLTIRSGPVDIACGEASVPVIVSNWTIVVTEYIPTVGELVLFQGDTNTTKTSCKISTNHSTESGILRIGGNLHGDDQDFRGRLTCLLFFDTKMDGTKLLTKIMSENCLYLPIKEKYCSISKQSSFYRLVGKNRKPEVDKSPIITVNLRKSLHCAKLCAETLYCRSFLVENLSFEIVVCRIFDFVEKNYLTSANGHKYYTLYRN